MVILKELHRLIIIEKIKTNYFFEILDYFQIRRNCKKFY